MKSSTKIFVLMSFLACIDSGLLKAYTQAEKEDRFDQHKDLHEQSLLIQQLEKYLKKEGRDPEFVARVGVSGGYCFGLSFLWAYGKRLQDEPITDPTKERDDYNFFNTTYRLLVTWDGETDFTEDQKHDIDRFLSNILLYQSKAKDQIFKETLGKKSQTDAVQYFFEDIKNGDEDISEIRKIKNEKTVRMRVSSPALLARRLSFYINPKRIIIVSFSDQTGHAMAVYKNESGTIEFYNPSDTKGEVTVDSVKHLADLLWKTYADTFPIGFNFCERDYKRNIGIDVYKFANDEEYYDYPSKERESSWYWGGGSSAKELALVATTPEKFIKFINDDCFELMKKENEKDLILFLESVTPIILYEALKKKGSRYDSLKLKDKKIIIDGIITHNVPVWDEEVLMSEEELAENSVLGVQ